MFIFEWCIQLCILYKIFNLAKIVVSQWRSSYDAISSWNIGLSSFSYVWLYSEGSSEYNQTFFM